MDETGGNRQKVYRFDQVFTQTTTQQDVYQGLGLPNLVNKVIEVGLFNDFLIAYRDITVQYLPMGRLAVGKLSQWRATTSR